MGALSHLRVLDLSRVLAGPWCSMILGDLGAEVVKIERPASPDGTGGDDTRGWGPPFVGDQSAYFLAANRNKKSVALDIAQGAGAAIVARLAERADVLIENFKVGGLARYGLDYATLSVRNPRLVYCSITGFGQDGPAAHRAGYDFMIQGMGGLMSLTGEPQGPPQKVGVALADIMTGLYAANAIQAALIARDKTGRGQHIDMALFDVQVATLANQGLNYLATGRAPTRLGNAHPNIVPYQAFATADGHVILAVGNDAQFQKLCAIVGADWAHDARFARNADRVRNRAELVARLADALARWRAAEFLAACDAAGVPAGPINNLDQVFDEPQARHRGLSFTMDHPAGAAPQLASPLRLSDTPVSYALAPPMLGEHTDAVLRDWLALTPDDIKSLRENGVVG